MRKIEFTKAVVEVVPNRDLMKIAEALPTGFTIALECEDRTLMREVAFVGKDDRKRWCVTRIVTERERIGEDEKQEV